MGILRILGICLCWVTLLCVVGVAVGVLWFYSQMNNQVKKHVLAELKTRYPSLDIRVGAARIVDSRGISIQDIEFSVPNPLGKPRPLLRIGEMFVECPVTMQSLYQNNLNISRITIKNPILRASLSPTGTFSELQMLVGGHDYGFFLLAGGSDYGFFFPDDSEPVVVEVHDGMLLYDDMRYSSPPLQFSKINLSISPTWASDGKGLGYKIGRSVPYFSIKGSAEGDNFRRVSVEAELWPETMQWKIVANCRQFDWTDDLWQYIPPHLYIAERPFFQGRFDFNVSAVSDPVADLGYRFAVNGTLMHGRADFPKMNRTLTELSTRFEISNDGLVINKLKGNSDFARLEASYVQKGFADFGGQIPQAELTLSLQDCRFDEYLIKTVLPFFNEETNRLLAKFEFNGMTDLYAQFSCRNGVWGPNKVSMQISDLGFSYRYFPYHVDRLSGNLYIDEKALLRFNLKSKQGSPIETKIDGHYYNIFEDIAGKLEVVGNNIPIDSKLLKALQPETQDVINSLRPTGAINTKLIFTLLPGNAAVNKQFDIYFDNVSIRYTLFPYPLRDVKGSVHYNGQVWESPEILGFNGIATVRGKGFFRPVSEQQHHISSPAQELVLYLLAEELPVDEQIVQALIKPEQQAMLQSLNVNGKVNLTAQIQYRTDTKNLNLNFQTAPRPGFSLFPDRFPYRIENVNGEIHYANGRIFSTVPLTGTHRNTRLRSDLNYYVTADGQSILRLAPFIVEHLHADKDLVSALPTKLQEMIESMQITGLTDLVGAVEYRQNPRSTVGRPNVPHHNVPHHHIPHHEGIAWDLTWVLRANDINLGLPVENLFGSIRLIGNAYATGTPNEHVNLSGEFNLDSLTVAGFQATALRGPFALISNSANGTQLRLGIPENRLLPESIAQPLTAQFYDGTLHAKGLVLLDSEMSYHINADLIGADLEKLTQVVRPTGGAGQEPRQTTPKTSGTFNCVNVNLRGKGMCLGGIEGTGIIQIRDANIYGAPFMVRMLRELRIREKDPNAGIFSVVDAGFRISKSNMFLDPVNFEGELFSLHGDGVVRLDSKQLDMTMKTRLGNRRMQIPIVSDILGGVGDQIVQLKITGQVGNPVVSRIALPEAQKAILQTHQEAAPPTSQDRSASARLFPWRPL